MGRRWTALPALTRHRCSISRVRPAVHRFVVMAPLFQSGRPPALVSMPSISADGVWPVAISKTAAMTDTVWAEMAADLIAALDLETPPVAITFAAAPPADVPAYSAPMPGPAADGRTGRVPAGCVFWMKAENQMFSTVAADHGNCSVGLLTHGFVHLEDVGGNDDVAALLESSWVSAEAVPSIPVVSRRPGSVVYAPLAVTPTEPSVVLLRINARQLMVLFDAVPGLRIEGKPQCHIVAVAHEQGDVVASVGCMLSRVRTGMPDEQMTCAVPAARLAEVTAAIQRTAAIDATVATVAREDSARF
jgi:uncharacterized protein (DUF169 family)